MVSDITCMLGFIKISCLLSSVMKNELKKLLNLKKFKKPTQTGRQKNAFVGRSTVLLVILTFFTYQSFFISPSRQTIFYISLQNR